MATTGAEIANAYVSLSVKFPGVQSQIEKSLGKVNAASAGKTVGTTFTSALSGAVAGGVAAITSKAVSMVASSIGSAVSRVDTMANFPKVMENLGYSATEAEASIKKMSDRLTGLPTSLDSMAGVVQQLAPLTGGLDEATELSLALNNALLAGGKSTEMQANAMEQYSQMLAVGKVDMAAWRSMVSAMPGQMDQLAVSLLGAGNKSMDLYTALQDGTVTFDDFNAAVVKLNTDGVSGFASFEKQAKSATGGIATGWANLQTAITRNVAVIIERLKPMISAFMVGATQVANALGPVVVGVIDVASAIGEWASANRDWLIPVGIFVGTLFSVYKGVKLVRAVTLGYTAAMKGAQIATFLTGGALKTYNILTAITAAKTKIVAAATRVWNTALRANPIGVIITVVAALVAALVYFFTQTEVGRKVWAEFTRFLGEAWTNIVNVGKAIWQGLGRFFTDLWEGIKLVFSTVVNWLVQLFLNWTIYGLIIQNWDAIKTFFVGLWEGIKTVFSTVVNWLVQLFLNWTIYGLIIKNWTAIKTFFVNLWNAITGWVKTKITQIKLIIQVTTAAISNAWKAVWGAIKTFFVNLWTALYNTVTTKIGQIKSFITIGVNAVKSVWSSVWWKINSIMSTVWQSIKSTVQTMMTWIKQKPKAAFEAARDAIGKAWSGIKDLAKKPVKFVIETVINGLIGTINKIPGVEIQKVKLPKGFARGGIIPGMSRMSDGDDQLIMARRGEGMMVSEALRTSADRAAFLAANAAGRRGVGFASMLQGFARGGLINPLPKGSYTVSQAWGNNGHNGIDLAAAQGTKVYAAAAGTVGLAGTVNMGGNEVYIQHKNGLGTRYSHLSRFATKAGQTVKAGNVIGYVGSTGMSTGPHLHYMVHNPGGGPGNYGNHVNPAPYMGVYGKDQGEASSIFDGLISWVKDKINDKFPGGGMWVDIAAGLAKKAAKTVIDVFTPKIGTDTGATLYDSGGWLPTGMSLVENRSGRPEPILTASQWDDLLSSNGSTGAATFVLYDADKQLIGTMTGIADDAVGRGFVEHAAELRQV